MNTELDNGSSKKKYYLKRPRDKTIPITEEQYGKIVDAKEVLAGGRRIEEKYHIVAVNYSAFEKYLTSQTVDWLIFRPTEFFDLNEPLIHINVHIANLLSSVRMYSDQIAHDIKECGSDNNSGQEVLKQHLSKQYDSDKNYRLMEKLRNYTQHRSSPAHKVNHIRKNVTREYEQYEHTIKVIAYRQRLLEDKYFNAKARSIIEEFEEEIDLKHAIRCYIGGLTKVHCEVRKFIQGVCEESRSIIKKHIDCFEEASRPIFLVTEKEDEIKKQPLSLSFDETRQKLIAINSGGGELAHHYISNSVSDPITDD